MPGSFAVGNDAYSDISEASGRSYDSKIGGKKVSFNRAVRVKQYPYNPETELRTSDHITLPSNRFWFKLHQNKPETSELTKFDQKFHEWDEKDMDCAHDLLSPISEVEDQDVDNDSGRDYQESKPVNTNFSTIESPDEINPPIEPPVDYLDYNFLNSESHFIRSKELPLRERINSTVYSDIDSNSASALKKAFVYENDKRHDIYKKSTVESSFDARKGYQPEESALYIPGMTIRNDFPKKSAIETLSNSNTRQGRSRSYDDYLENDRYIQLKRADKSVSTDYLIPNSNNSLFTQRFQTARSRDMATQCNGTLLRQRNFQRPESYNSKADLDRLNNFKSPTSVRSSLNEKHCRTSKQPVHPKNENFNEFSKGTFANNTQAKNDIASRGKGIGYRNHDTSGKQQTGHKLFNQSEKPTSNVTLKHNGIMRKVALPKRDMRSQWSGQSEPKNKTFGESKQERNAATIGYLRGKQIPLSEVNTNVDRKFANRLETRSISSKANDVRNSPSPKRAIKLETPPSNRLHSPQSVFCKVEYNNGRHTTYNQPDKSYSTDHSASNDPMFDWSLSGFHLAARPEIGKSSISDSEYTVHKRHPLLMYIPGVSHHDRPAIEDDRMSALSDLSRSELYDDLHSRPSRNKNPPVEMSRRYSMPRDSKVRWMKWGKK